MRYQRLAIFELPELWYYVSMNICKVEGCDKRSIGRGLCSKHYQRFMHHGSTEPMEIHDGLRTRYPDEYRSWYSMVRRCTKQNQSGFKNYGAKGVTLCERWQGGRGFRNFLEDMGQKPSHGNTSGGMPLYTIDRIDQTKGYTPDNCVWADWGKQAQHRSNTGETPGVNLHKQSGLWCAHKTVNRVRRQKYFKTKEEAIAQRKEWDK